MNNLQHQINVLQQIVDDHLIEIEKLQAQLNSKPPFEISPKFIERTMNLKQANEYCQFLGNNWRLPTKEEIIFLLNRDNDLNPNWYYWTSNTNQNTPIAIHINTGNHWSGNSKYPQHCIRPVRDIQESLPFEIIDKSKELYLNWYDANNYCEFLGNNWRLPTLDELVLIKRHHNYDFTKSQYWSSTTSNTTENIIVTLDMKDGSHKQEINLSTIHLTRPIRNLN